MAPLPEMLARSVSTEEQIALESYAKMVRRWNSRTGLISKRDIQRIETRHIGESLEVLPFLANSVRHCDIGSGGGVPGIPIAIVRPDMNVLLMERSFKKCRFLRQVVIELGLSNVQIDQSDAAAATATESFNSTTARAAAPPPEVWKWSKRLLERNGRMVLQTGSLGCENPFEGGKIIERKKAHTGWIYVVALAGA